MANQLSKIAVGAGLLAASSAAMAADKPNILAILVTISATGISAHTTKV